MTVSDEKDLFPIDTNYTYLRAYLEGQILGWLGRKGDNLHTLPDGRALVLVSVECLDLMGATIEDLPEILDLPGIKAMEAYSGPGAMRAPEGHTCAAVTLKSNS